MTNPQSIFAGLLADHNPKHDPFQIDHFVLGKHAYTTFGMYRQTLRQLMSKTTTLADQYSELDLAGIDRLELETQTEFDDPYEEARTKVKLRQVKVRQMVLARSVEAQESEWLRYLAWAISLKDKVGTVSQADIEEFWTEKLVIDSACRIKQGGHPSWDTIYSLPHAIRSKVLRRLENPREIDDMLKARENPVEAAAIELDHETIRSLVNDAIDSQQYLGAGGPVSAPLGDLLAD